MRERERRRMSFVFGGGKRHLFIDRGRGLRWAEIP